MRLGLGIRVNWPSLAKLSPLVDNYKDRVIADGGTVESLRCVKGVDFAKFNWKFYFRVIEDGGVVESLECVTI